MASPAAFQAATGHPDFPGRDLPFTAHPGLYQVLREDPPPPEDPGGVVLVNAFEVPPDSDDAFLATQPGYLATRLDRSLAPDADFRFVNIGRHTSPQAFQTAIGQPQFRRPPPPSSTAPIPACTRSSGADGAALSR